MMIMAFRCVLWTLLLLGTVSARYLCPGENTTLKCDHEALRNGDKIEDVVWKVWKSYRGWTSVAVCNRSLVCMVNESEVTDGIKVLGITKGTLTIKRTTRNATTSHLDFKCEIHNGSHALTHHVKIKLAGECIWTRMGADVNLTGHLNRIVTWKNVEDIELYDTMGEKQKFANCNGATRQCKLEKPVGSPPSFWSRLERIYDSILLTGIQEDDEGLGMRVKIHLTSSVHWTFTLRIRLNTSQGSPQGPDVSLSTMNKSSHIELPFQVHGYDGAPIVRTQAGQVAGKIETLPFGKLVHAFLGIPYAEPPIGESRFAAPKPAKRWFGIRNATEYGARCPQPDYPLPHVKIAGQENEDCLFLNVFVPWTTKRSKPHDRGAVMVWIQGFSSVVPQGRGRAFTLGSSTEYPGHVLASFNDVIVVTLNYRLGILGFFNEPDTDIKGNYGMYDQIQALKWVQANIASFGGDPNRVTLFGESAGASSISLHLISPLSKGLFSRAILQSGAASSPLPTGRVAKTWQELEKIANCKVKTKLIQCLRSKSTEEIMSLQTKLSSSSSMALLQVTSPVVDGEFLPDLPDKLFKLGKFSNPKVDVMIGFNSHETALSVALRPGNLTQDGVYKHEFESDVKFILERGLRPLRKDRSRMVEELVRFHYTDHDDPDNKTTIREMMIDFESDFMTVAPAMFQADALAKAGTNLYLYVFEHRPDFSPFPRWTGAFHGVDIGFVFGAPFKRMRSLVDLFTPKFSEIEKGFSLYVMKLWTDFAKFGSPTPSGSSSSPITWHPFTEENQFYLALDVKPRLGQHYRAREVAFWNELIPKISKGRKGKSGKAL